MIINDKEMVVVNRKVIVNWMIVASWMVILK